MWARLDGLRGRDDASKGGGPDDADKGRCEEANKGDDANE